MIMRFCYDINYTCWRRKEVCYNADMEITLEQLLSARDHRAAYIKTLQTQFPGACIAVLGVVTPGAVKRTQDTVRLFEAAIQAVSRVISRNELIPLLFEAHEQDTGDEAYLAVKTEPGFLKMEFCKLEESVPYGRLWDMDVYRPGGTAISREEVGFAERACFVCGRTGRTCYSRRLHTEQEVLEAYQNLLRTLPD